MILRVGNTGELVGQLHQLLVEAGHEIAAEELDARLFGQTTYQAVRAVQASRVAPDGHALAEDGIAGPSTMWALQHGGDAVRGRYTAPGWRVFPGASRETVHPILAAAVGEIGNREQPDGSNAGPMIDKYGQRGQPWCCYFISWCYGQFPEVKGWGIIGSVWALYEWAQRNGKVLGGAGLPQPGDVFVILRPGRHGHCGIIGSLSDDMSAAHTIEGNAANAVRGLIRPRTSLSAVLRPVPL